VIAARASISEGITERSLEARNTACRVAAGTETENVKICNAVDQMIKELDGKGYCVYGHGAIGRKGRGNHCYTIKDERQ
jgi:hypothetical protein